MDTVDVWWWCVFFRRCVGEDVRCFMESNKWSIARNTGRSVIKPMRYGYGFLWITRNSKSNVWKGPKILPCRILREICEATFFFFLHFLAVLSNEYQKGPANKMKPFHALFSIQYSSTPTSYDPPCTQFLNLKRKHLKRKNPKILCYWVCKT